MMPSNRKNDDHGSHHHDNNQTFQEPPTKKLKPNGTITSRIDDPKVQEQIKRSSSLWEEKRDGLHPNIWNTVYGQLQEGKVPPIFHAYVNEAEFFTEK